MSLLDGPPCKVATNSPDSTSRTVIDSSPPATASCFPSGRQDSREEEVGLAIPWFGSRQTNGKAEILCPPITSQTLTVPSSPAEASRSPSRLQASDRNGC